MGVQHPPHPDIPPFEYSQITDEIFIGTNQCCVVHFKDSLLKKGITADISLEEEEIDQPFGVSSFLWLPTKDEWPPTQTQLAIGTSHLHELLLQKIKVYVHCKNGHGRAPTLVAAYLIKYHNMDIATAIEFLQSKRSMVHLSEGQIEALKMFRARL